MRDNLKNVEYFNNFLTQSSSLIISTEKSILEGKVVKDNIEFAKFRNFGFRLESVVAQYSKGDAIEELKNSIIRIIEQLDEETHPSSTKVKKRIGQETVILDHYYYEPYERFLRLLSLAFLLNVGNSDFGEIVKVFDRDNVSDDLYEFIIKARNPDRVQKKEEEYAADSYILKIYKNLRQACDSDDKSEAEKLVKKFLEKDFYNKEAGFYNFHKSKVDLYYGYWSFEAAAVTCIKGLDDSSYRDHPYYPKDLADYYRENVK